MQDTKYSRDLFFTKWLTAYVDCGSISMSPNCDKNKRKEDKLMAKILALSGLIHSKFENEAGMARELGWSRQRLNKITNGDKEPDLYEVRDISDALGESFMTVAQIFLDRKSPNCDTNE